MMFTSHHTIQVQVDCKYTHKHFLQTSTCTYVCVWTYLWPSASAAKAPPLATQKLGNIRLASTVNTSTFQAQHDITTAVNAVALPGGGLLNTTVPIEAACTYSNGSNSSNSGTSTCAMSSVAETQQH
jgi:hypothetical protein